MTVLPHLIFIDFVLKEEQLDPHEYFLMKQYQQLFDITFGINIESFNNCAGCVCKPSKNKQSNDKLPGASSPANRKLENLDKTCLLLTFLAKLEKSCQEPEITTFHGKSS